MSCILHLGGGYETSVCSNWRKTVYIQFWIWRCPGVPTSACIDWALFLNGPSRSLSALPAPGTRPRKVSSTSDESAQRLELGCKTTKFISAIRPWDGGLAPIHTAGWQKRGESSSQGASCYFQQVGHTRPPSSQSYRIISWAWSRYQISPPATSTPHPHLSCLCSYFDSLL